MSYQNENNTIFLKNSKCSKNINFLVKIIYNILCIIKKVYKFRKLFFLVLNKPFSNPIVSTVQSKTPKNVSKKKNQQKLQFKKRKGKIKITLKSNFFFWICKILQKWCDQAKYPMYNQIQNF